MNHSDLAASEALFTEIQNTNTGSTEVEGALTEYSREAVEALVASGRVEVRDYQAVACSLDHPEAWLQLSESYLESVGLRYCPHLNQYVARDGSECVGHEHCA